MSTIDEYGREGASRADIEIIRAYGVAHDDVWVEMFIEREPLVTLVAVFFTEDLHVHEEALRELVSRPDRLVVRQSSWPPGHIDHVAEILQARMRYGDGRNSSFKSVGRGKEVVRVWLDADREEFARDLTEEFGNAVDITVGSLHFPDMARAWPARLAQQPDAPRLTTLPPHIAAHVDAPLVVAAGASLRARLRLTNHGNDTFVLNTNGGVVARVVDPVNGQVVGGWSGAQAMPLIKFGADPGTGVEVPLLIGTASSRAELGYCVPAGSWAINVRLTFETIGEFVTPDFPLEITS
jgi:hypothetical protein